MRRRMLRAGRWLVGAAVTAAAALVGLALTPTLFGYDSLVVANGSMEPGMPLGSMVLTRMVEAGDLTEGHVISVRRPGADVPVTHRVVDVEREPGQLVLTTKGDANDTPDPEPVVMGASDRAARVTFTVPYAGYVVGLARTPAGGVLLFLLPIVGLVLEGRKRRSTRDRAPAQIPARCPECVRAGRRNPAPPILKASSDTQPNVPEVVVVELPRLPAPATKVPTEAVDMTGAWALGPRRRLGPAFATGRQGRSGGPQLVGGSRQ